MRRALFSCLVVLLVITTLIVCIKESNDEELQLELILSAEEYKAGEPIECKAVLSYTGEDECFEFLSGDPVVMFAIDGGKYFDAEKSLLNKGVDPQIIYKDEPMEFPFKKYVGFHLNTDEEAVSFWENFLKDEELVLEPGEYEIFAQCWYVLEMGGEVTTITVSEKVTVK